MKRRTYHHMVLSFQTLKRRVEFRIGVVVVNILPNPLFFATVTPHSPTLAIKLSALSMLWPVFL